jgi:hypothetical protein
MERRIALIGNVNDKREAQARAERLLGHGEIDAYYFVSDHLDHALKITGLTRRDLGRVPYYTDWALVAVTLPGSPYLLHWDAEVRLQEPTNWIDSALEFMESDKRILVANPNWRWPTLEIETLRKVGDFALGYGFSDQLFLVRREDLARPIYSGCCPASLRYPLAHITPIFEQRVDTYMRKNRRLRATYFRATYEHWAKEGNSYPALGWIERVKFLRNRGLIRLLRRCPTTNPCWRVWPASDEIVELAQSS